MDTQDLQVQGGLDRLLLEIANNVPRTVSSVRDILRWSYYGQSVLSQFGLGLRGHVFRQRPASVLMTTKVQEGDVPLVAFVTAGTTTGCIEQMFDLLYDGRLKWQRDKYPWV